MRNFKFTLLFLFFSFLSQTFSLSYTYILQDGQGNMIQQLLGNDVLLMTEYNTIQLQIQNTGATSFTFSNIQGSTPSGSFSQIPSFFQVQTINSAPFLVYKSTVSNSLAPINPGTIYTSSGYTSYQVTAKDSRSGQPTETFTFFIEPTEEALCARIQANLGRGIKCNHGTCVAQAIGNTCSCSTGWTNYDCSTCATGFTGANCDQCIAGYYGPNCTPCPDCGHGVCQDGITGSGNCTCDQGWTTFSLEASTSNSTLTDTTTMSTWCNVCDDGWMGDECNACVVDYYGVTCDPCQDCDDDSEYCDDGLTGTGECLCYIGWEKSSPASHCDLCSSGYYGEDCSECPDCGSNGYCDDGIDGSGECFCNLGWISSEATCDICDGGYFGSNCEACPNCGPHGTCDDGINGLGSCICTTGWTSASGNCNACDDNYFGVNCTACPSCGHGICDDGVAGDVGGTGQCTCNVGWMSTPEGKCNTCAHGYYGVAGHLGTTCEACRDCGLHGSCDDGLTGTGNCICNTGWENYGEGICNACVDGYFGANCTICPFCGLQGTCDDGVAGDTGGTGQCSCAPGWTNYGRDFCNACDAGYFGVNCTACPSCGHGICDDGIVGDVGGTGECICSLGWRSFNGNCNICSSGYYGSNCQACQHCGIGGVCRDGIGGDGKCICAIGWTTNGTSDLCASCSDGFYGPTCLSCPNCGPGYCDQGVPGDTGGTGACICPEGWASSVINGYCDICRVGLTGEFCETCADGFQSPNCTTCAPGFQGTLCNTCVAGIFPDCYVPISCPKNCSNHGNCNSRTGKCRCMDGFIDSGCDTCSLSTDPYPFCTIGIPCPSNCSDHGFCNGASGTCDCDIGYTSVTCNACDSGYTDYPNCYFANSCPKNCSNAGTCNQKTGKCDCGPRYAGNACEKCTAGYQNPNEGCWKTLSCGNCSENGICNAKTGECECQPGYTGLSCSIALRCYFNPCANNGSCVEVFETRSYTCSCLQGFFGTRCQYVPTFPHVNTVSPMVLPLVGGTIIVRGSDFIFPVTVRVVVSNVVVLERVIYQYNGGSKRALLSFNVFIPQINVAGYISLIFINPSGDSTTYQDFFVTDDCPYEGVYGVGSNCTACPEGGYCPGGNRIWPMNGYWSPDEVTLPQPCSDPPSRCLGGRFSPCSIGYTGSFCAFCEEGYYVPDDQTGCIYCGDGDCTGELQINTSLYFFLGILVVVLLALCAYVTVQYSRERKLKRTQSAPLLHEGERLLPKKFIPGAYDKFYDPDDMHQPEVEMMPAITMTRASISSDSSSSSEQSEVVSTNPLQYDRVSFVSQADSYQHRGSIDNQDNYYHYNTMQSSPQKHPSTIWESALEYRRQSWMVSSETDHLQSQKVLTTPAQLEAVILDRTLKSIPANTNLYDQILNTNRSDLAMARIANQVTKKIMTKNLNKVLKDDVANELEIQKLVDQFTTDIAWRVVGSINALTKKGTFGKKALQKQSFDLNFTVQVSEDRGARPTMETKWFAQLFAHELMGLGLQPKISILAVHDGFGGSEVSEYVARHLHVNLMRNPNFKISPYDALFNSYFETNEAITDSVIRNEYGGNVGCSSVMVMIRENELWCSWVGNAQAVLFRQNNEFVSLCQPHTLENEEEAERLADSNVMEVNGRKLVEGISVVTRALGCSHLAGKLICEPEIISIDFQGNEEYLVLACDTLWNVVSPEALSVFLQQIETSQVADAIIKYARSLGAADNITVSVLTFDS